MPKQNLIAFFIVSAFLIAGWFVLTNYLWERPQPAQRPVTAQNKKDEAAKKLDKDAAAKDIGKEKELEKKEHPALAAQDKEKEKEAPATELVQQPPESLTLG